MPCRVQVYRYMIQKQEVCLLTRNVMVKRNKRDIVEVFYSLEMLVKVKWNTEKFKLL